MLGQTRRYRLSKSMTQQELAALASVTQSAISRLETGSRAPSFALACRIALALGVPLVALHTKEGMEEDAA